jgi:hypothetical protein
MPLPRVSVALPVYNGAAQLRRQLDSIKAQTFTDFIVHLIDNASTDDTPLICREYAEADPRFVYMRNRQNIGFWASYNKGYYLSTSYEFMIYASHNDYGHPEYLEKCVREMDRGVGAGGVNLVYSYCQFLDHNGAPASIFGPGHPPEPYKDDFDLGGSGKPPWERYLTIVGQLGMCTAFYGLIRMDSFMNPMVRGALNIGTAANDNLILAFLAQIGRFIQIPEPLFFRELPYAQGTTIAGRITANAAMCAQNAPLLDYGFTNFLWYHLGGALITTWRPVEERERAARGAISALIERYKDRFEFEVAHAVERVCQGHLYRQMGAEEDLCAPNDPEKTCFMANYWLYINHLQNLNALSYFLPDIPNLNLARACCYAAIGRPREALVAAEAELEKNPTSRLAQELKIKLAPQFEKPGPPPDPAA